MQATLEKLGDSLMVRIPGEFLQEAEIADSDTIDISMWNGRILISRSDKRLKTLKERMVEFYGTEDYMKYSEPPEVVDWGPPVGREVW